MKTYAESKHHNPFDWYKALNEEYPDWHTMANLAGSWVTCACGNQCDIIPRKKGMPLDPALFTLGNNFTHAVTYEHRELAIQILNEIEKRSAHLINKINNQKK